jgi:SAM-dependent MidA family methyltransferase
MAMALYHPELGYYERTTSIIGKNGDFFTNVSVGDLFGALLTTQFLLWRAEDDCRPFQVLEAGAHDGQLARDILTAVRAGSFNAVEPLEYWILEPSPRRQAWQRETLREFAGAVRWFDRWGSLPTSGVCGVIFANELLDAFPVRRFGWDATSRTWFEWGVKAEGDRFEWVRMQKAVSCPWSVVSGQLSVAGGLNLPFPGALNLPDELRRLLPDRFTVDVCPAASEWWGKAAKALRRGHLLTLDYGVRTEDALAPERACGTLQAYYRHHVSRDVLARPGEQDLTAPVDWTVLQATGENAGLTTEAFLPQERFLTQIAARSRRGSTPPDLWSPARMRQFHTLTHPEHLGHALEVLVQASK